MSLHHCPPSSHKHQLIRSNNVTALCRQAMSAGAVINMESTVSFRTNRGRANGAHPDSASTGRRAHHKNKHWVADGATGRSSTPHAGADAERWDRGGYRGSRGRGRGTRGKFPNATVTFRQGGVLDTESVATSEGDNSEVEDATDMDEVEEHELETPEEKERFWKELVKAREVERKKAIAEGKMDDPNVAKRLEDAITMVGTCMDMCPRFERYRRERENNLFEWEIVPGTKRVDHKRAVKMYERAAGDKTLPSDLRPPKVLRRTLDYLFHDLLPRGGFSATFSFIRDRSRAVRSDFTMQHEMGPIAIECHDRCARFHILGLHLERDRPGSQVGLEEQQLKYTLQSLKEFYEDQRGKYQSQTELEMRVYHRLIHIRDQKERHEDIPSSILDHPVFKLTTKFRLLVQAKSAPITRSSPLSVDHEAMGVFSELITVLQGEGNYSMIYLVACIIEHLFGTDTVDNIESLRENLTIPDIIDGNLTVDDQHGTVMEEVDAMQEEEEPPFVADMASVPQSSSKPLGRSGTQWLNDTFGPVPTESAFITPSSVSDSPKSAFSNMIAVPNVFGPTTFQTSTADSASGFGSAPATTSPFGSSSTQAPAFSQAPSSVFRQSPLVPSSTPTVISKNDTHTVFTASPPTFSEPLLPSSTIPKADKAADTSSIQQPLNPQASIFTPNTSLSSGTGPSVTFTTNSDLTSTTSTSVIDQRVLPLNGSGSMRRRPSDFFDDLPDTTSAVMPVTSKPQGHTLPFSSILGQSAPTRQPPVLPSIVTSQPTSSAPHDSFSTLDETPPSQPPPLSRRHLISLPPTPTTTSFIPSAFAGTPTKSILGSLKNLQTSSLTAAPTEILSPLALSSPGTKFTLGSMPSLTRHNSMQTPLRSGITAADLEIISTKLENGKATDSSPTKQVDKEILNSKAFSFVQKSLLVKGAFREWRERTIARTKWKEACQRSDAYSQRVQAQRLSKSTSSMPQESKPKVVSPERPSSVRKRLRSRLSSEYRPPPSDDELVKRFEKNREDNERRWARGSFLHVLQQHLMAAACNVPNNWSAWLSLNQDNDGTAIWLDLKFNVPESGSWRDIHIFEIPMVPQLCNSTTVYPGIIFFERTPISEVSDPLERKYRMLDDCSRLRDIIESLPPDRHFIPSLLTISWSDEGSESSDDFNDMIAAVLHDGISSSHVNLTLASTTWDLDSKFQAALQSLKLDIEGSLVRWMSVPDIFRQWKPVWQTFTSQQLEQGIINGEFDWGFHSRFLELCIELLNAISNATLQLICGKDFEGVFPLEMQHVRDSDSTFDVVLRWLDNPLLHDASGGCLVDVLRSHLTLGREFPSGVFVQDIFEVAQEMCAQRSGLNTPACIRKSHIDTAASNIAAKQKSYSDELSALRVAKLRQSSKRIASLDASSTRYSTPTKRRRLSTSDDSALSDRGSPPLSTTSPGCTSPSINSSTTSLAPEKSTVVTPAMLRALTRDIRTKFDSY